MGADLFDGRRSPLLGVTERACIRPAGEWCASDEAGTAGKAGKPRARKSRKKKESPEDE